MKTIFIMGFLFFSVAVMGQAPSDSTTVKRQSFKTPAEPSPRPADMTVLPSTSTGKQRPSVVANTGVERPYNIEAEDTKRKIRTAPTSTISDRYGNNSDTTPRKDDE